MKINVKSAAKVAGAACAATGVVALSALVASGAAAGAIVEGFISAKDTMKKLLADEAGKETSDDEQQGDDGAVEDNVSETENTPEEIIVGNICPEPEAAGTTGTA